MSGDTALHIIVNVDGFFCISIKFGSLEYKLLAFKTTFTLKTFRESDYGRMIIFVAIDIDDVSNIEVVYFSNAQVWLQ